MVICKKRYWLLAGVLGLTPGLMWGNASTAAAETQPVKREVKSAPATSRIIDFGEMGKTVHRICQHFQIGIPSIMPLKKIGQRITRLLRQMFIFKIRTGIMAGN
jgi:hypothetical protein